MILQNEISTTGLTIFMGSDFEDWPDDEEDTPKQTRYRRGTFSESDSEEDDI